MRVVIGYESMYGNTRRIAEAIAAGFTPADQIDVLPVAALESPLSDVDLLVVGMPTHGHTLPTSRSRRTAANSARSAGPALALEPGAGGTGVREWLVTLPDHVNTHVATYDTRFRAPGWLTGHPARRVLRTLVSHGATAVTEAESFFVDKHEQLRPDELTRAQEWGASLWTAMASESAHRQVR